MSWMRSTSPAAISARFMARLPCERSGTGDSCLSRATMSTASPGSMVASGQSSGSCRVVEITVVGMLRMRALTGSSSDASIEPSSSTNCRKVVAPRIIRWSSL